MDEISKAGAAQTRYMLPVTEACIRMDQATQQNAALVEESAAAADNLNGQAHQGAVSEAFSTLRPTQGDRLALGQQLRSGCDVQ